jgi:acetyltransferase-like isoleucine patch superfamily enzyme
MKKGSFLSNLSSIGANIIIEENVFIGMGSTITSGITRIGTNSIIGAGSIVIHDVLPNTVVAGVPAKITKYLDKK